MDTIDAVEEFQRAFGLPVRDQFYDKRADNSMLPVEFEIALDALADIREAAKVFHRLAKVRPEYEGLIRAQLMTEELAEVIDAMFKGQQANMLQELSDLQYVLDGTYLTYGLANMKQAAFLAVHRANLSKLGPDGKPIRDQAGRVVKGPNYHKPDIGAIVVNSGVSTNAEDSKSTLHSEQAEPVHS